MSVARKLEEMLERNLYPDLSVHPQSGPSLCGIAAIRSVLDAQYGVSESEEEIIEAIGWRKGWRERDTFDFVRHYGTSPRDLADHFKDRCPGKVKVFCSRRGNATRLDELLRENQMVPIIHQLVADWNEGKLITDGHYLVFTGQSEAIVRVFDPSPKEGFRYLPVPEFHRRWYNPCLGERWYLAVVPEGLTLNPEKFKGKYL